MKKMYHLAGPVIINTSALRRVETYYLRIPFRVFPNCYIVFKIINDLRYRIGLTTSTQIGDFKLYMILAIFLY